MDTSPVLDSINPNVPCNSNTNQKPYTFTSSLTGWKYIVQPDPVTGLFHCFCCNKGYAAGEGRHLGRHLRGRTHIDPTEWTAGVLALLMQFVINKE
jgi:hypothetical protein